jgi:ParB-like nuclease domain
VPLTLTQIEDTEPPPPGLPAWPADRVDRRPVSDLIPYAMNARTHSSEQISQLAESIRQWGWTMPVLVDESDVLIAGHGRVMAAQRLGITEVPAMVARGWTDAQIRAYRIADNQLALNAAWDKPLLGAELAALMGDGFDLGSIGFSQDEISTLLEGGGESGEGKTNGSLAARFLIPPFSVLNAREGWWQERKRLWLAIGIKSELGRGENALVAARLGRRYVGVDLRSEQCEANESQIGILQPDDPSPEWRCGDSRDIRNLCADVDADFIFSCPPYADLERYSDDPRDLSTMEYAEFLAAYRAVIAAACARLRPDRFACFVVGDLRGPDGAYRGFIADTIRAFTDAGLSLYNEAILVTMVGTLPIRAATQFAVSRKLGKTHQNVLVFINGDPRVAASAIGECEFGEGDVGSTDDAPADA